MKICHERRLQCKLKVEISPRTIIFGLLHIYISHIHSTPGAVCVFFSNITVAYICFNRCVCFVGLMAIHFISCDDCCHVYLKRSSSNEGITQGTKFHRAYKVKRGTYIVPGDKTIGNNSINISGGCLTSVFPAINLNCREILKDTTIFTNEDNYVIT